MNTSVHDFEKDEIVEVTHWWMDGRKAVSVGEMVTLCTRKTDGSWIGTLYGTRTVTVPTPLEKYIKKT